MGFYLIKTFPLGTQSNDICQLEVSTDSVMQATRPRGIGLAEVFRGK
jgi:hypothetical protein